MVAERDAAQAFEARVDYPYWAALERSELMIQRCSQCRRWSWPADWRCGACGSFDFTWEAVQPVGTVYSYIRTHVPFVAAYADLVPYVNVLVELPQAGGARLMGLLRGSESGLAIGASVVGKFDEPSARTSGRAVLTWTLGAAS